MKGFRTNTWRYSLTLSLLFLLSGCPSNRSQAPPPEPSFIGSQRCSECHQEEAKDWTESQHHQAMALPTDETVLGDFNNTEFDYFGIKTRFYRKGKEFRVTTDGPDGVSQSYRVEYTFGVKPLQQYLIKFPDGRLQALSVCWDTEKKRWFHLHPDEKVDFKNPLHWTGPQYNWNFMCSECHSTGVHKNYDEVTDTYKTSYQEINVSCESCHGPGSNHLEFLGGEKLPNKGFLTNLQGRGPWEAQTAEHPPRPAHPDRETDQLDTCARCHARRSQLNKPYVHGEPIGQTHSVSVLEEDLYHPDGQIDEEVYVYGSFLQSKMYKAGVVCTDCHDPHTARVKLKGELMCLSCHLPSRYQVPEHSHHQEVSCLDCHMPGKIYMGNDFRRDHSFRIPRPDISLETGSPNACNQCHKDKSSEWASQAFLKWYGEPEAHYGLAFHRLQSGDPSAAPEVAAIVTDHSYPDIVRATAVSLAPSVEVVSQALKDESDLVRREAVRAFQGAPAEMREQYLVPLASDPIRMVRIEAGRLLADLNSSDPSVKKAVEEFEASLRFNADRVESRLGLLELLVNQGQADQAERELQSILKRYPTSPQVYVNGADFYRARGSDDRGKELLQEGLSRLSPPETAALHHSLGLLLVRQKEYDDALKELELALQEAPENTRYAYVYAVALDSLGQTQRAVEVLQKAVRSRPLDAELSGALESFQQKLSKSK